MFWVWNLKLILSVVNLKNYKMISSEKEKELNDRLGALRGYL
jgi:hypothetical protein